MARGGGGHSSDGRRLGGQQCQPPPPHRSARRWPASERAHLQPSKPTCVRSQTIHSQRSRFTNSCSQGRGRKKNRVANRLGGDEFSMQMSAGSQSIGKRRAGPGRCTVLMCALMLPVGLASPPLDRTWLWSMLGAAPNSSPEERLPAPRYSEWSPTIARSSQLMRPPNWFHTPPCPWCCAQRWLSTASPSTLMPWLCSVLTHLQGGRQARHGMRSAQDCSRAQTVSSYAARCHHSSLSHRPPPTFSVAKAAASCPLT
jgi:hypothetical protein